MKTFSIYHISHGIAPTGGFRHEEFLKTSIAAALKRDMQQVEEKTIRANRFFKGWAQLRLLWFGFINATATANIIVSRVALSSLIRNAFNNKKNIIVFHYFDERDGKGVLLRWYYALLFLILRNFKFTDTLIVVVAPFWLTYFNIKVTNRIPVFLFPNFFETEKYLKYRTGDKLKQIHLGQFSFKNDERVFELAKELSKQGYVCYFSTMIKDETGKFDGYEVRCEDYETYLSGMAKSLYTISFIKINEGWNRIAHESILVGTTLIANDAGGLGDLVKESGSLTANNVVGFLNHIANHNHPPVNASFIEKYDVKNAPEYIRPLIEFILK